MGKGDKRRPTRVEEDRFQAAWDRVFGPARSGADVSTRRELDQTTNDPEGASDEDRS